MSFSLLTGSDELELVRDLSTSDLIFCRRDKKGQEEGGGGISCTR